MPSTPYARSIDWSLVRPVQVNVSEWTGARQALDLGRGWWECDYTLPPIVGNDARAWQVFVALARGGANTFEVLVTPSKQSPFVSAVPLVNGGSQTGRSLVTDGWPVSATPLYAGQYVTVNDQLLQLTADVTANGSGQATISFEPPLRASPADNAAIEYLRPYCLMYVTQEPVQGGTIGQTYTLALKLREAF
jgi:hypothetical protein